MTGWEDVVEELPTEIRAELFPVEATTAEERALLVERICRRRRRRLYELFGRTKRVHVDELVEPSG